MSCSSGLPCAFDTALNVIQAGQTIELAYGTYRLGEIPFPRSGSAGSYVTIRGSRNGIIFIQIIYSSLLSLPKQLYLTEAILLHFRGLCLAVQLHAASEKILKDSLTASHRRED